MHDERHAILHEIITNVNNQGSYEVPFEVLKNTAFQPGGQPLRSTKEQILLWSAEHQFMYEYKGVTSTMTVRFFRK